jgi:predicted transcriptional regulator
VSETSNLDLVNLTAEITANYVGNNKIGTDDVGGLITAIFRALEAAGSPTPEPEAAPSPFVSVRASIKPDYIVCLECGGKQKMLKRHLMTAHSLSPTEYRDKWRLPRNYPLVASNYADQRRTLAKESGLGRGGRKAVEAIVEPVKNAAARGRKTLGIAAAKAATVAHLEGDKPATPAKRGPGRPKKATAIQGS